MATTIISTLIANRRTAGWDATACHTTAKEHQKALELVCAGKQGETVERLFMTGATEL